jgi:hypothetical protein
VISAGHELIVVRDDGWPGMPAVEEVELWMCFVDGMVVSVGAGTWMLSPGCLLGGQTLQ